jgi:hypothetical protein
LSFNKTYMSTSVPDGISFADLEKLAKDAPDDSAIVPTKGPYNGLTEDQLKDLVDAHLELIHEACPHPMFAKAVIWRLISNMMNWHTEAGIIQMTDGDPESAVCWLRDAGKFQAMANLLQTINIGPDDFITPTE